MSESLDQFAEFLEKIGHKIVNVNGTYWYDTHPRVFTSLPVDASVVTTREDRSILAKEGAMVLRHTCPLEMGRESYALRIEEAEYSLSSLTSKARNQTRRGLENCVVDRISLQQSSSHAIQLNRETLERQGRSLPVNLQSYWDNYYVAADDCECIEAWAAFVDNELAAFLICAVLNQTAHIMIVRSSRKFLKSYPNNALLFTFAQNFLSRGAGHRVSIGLESLQEELGSLDHFKVGLGFKKVQIGQRIEIVQGLLNILAREPVVSVAAKAVSKLRSKSENISKFHGMLVNYREQPKLR